MRLALNILSTLSLSLATGPCQRLCDSDGPQVCTGGSWLRSGPSGDRCHAYFRRSDGGHCYHTSETRETCPDSLPHLTREDAELILQSRGASERPAGSVPATASLPVQPSVRRRVIPSAAPQQTAEAPAALPAGPSDPSEAAPRRRQRCYPGGYGVASATAALTQESVSTVAQEPIAEPSATPRRRQRCYPGGIPFAAPAAPVIQGPASAALPQPPTGPIQRQSAHVFPVPLHPGHLVRQTAHTHLPVQFHPAPAVPVVHPTPLTPESVADAIGAAFRGDWSQFCVSIASLMSRLEVPAVSGPEQSADFWTRANGDAILASAVAAHNCQGHDQNECFALMLLISYMPLPTNQDEALAFMTAHGIVQFVESQAESLANRLLASEGNLMSVNVPGHLYGQIDIRGMGLLYGFAVSWSQRFPQIIAARSGLSRLVLRHAIYRQSCNEPHSYEEASLRVLRSSALESSSQQLMMYSGPVLRKGINGVRFIGEDAVGVGLRQEWFALMAEAIRGPVFKQRDESDVLQLDLSEGTTLDNLRAVGRYFALCIIQGRPTGFNLPVAFFKLLAGQQVSVEDSREIDQTFYSSMRQYVGDISQEQFEGLTFGLEEDPLMGSGATEPLTMANKDAQVVMAVENLIMNHNRPAFDALVEGFISVIPREVLSTVAADDVKSFVSGSSHIDAVEFFNDIDFVSSSSILWTTERIEWIRQIINSFNQERLSKLLRFVTGFQVLPTGGFPALGRIQFKAYLPSHVRLPTAHTCFKSLDMPQYATFEETRETLTNVVDLGNFADMSEGGR